LFLLGLRTKAGKVVELVVYAKDSEPFQVVALKRLDQVPDLPVELEWRRGEKKADTLTITILGQYQGVLMVARQAD